MKRTVIDANDLVALAGLGLIAWGFGLIWLPLGLIAAGLVLVAAGTLGAMRKGGPKA